VVEVPTVLRAALPSIPGLNQLPGIRKDPKADLGSVVETRTATIDADAVAAYSRVCEFPAKDTIPLPFPHMLAFPLHMAILTSPAYPFPAIGSVHVDNVITSHRPLRVGETLDLSVRAVGPREHPKGTVVDFLADARVGEELVWESTSTYLRRGKPHEGAAPGLTFDRIPPGTTQWRLPEDLGRRYGAVSGDRNPIHLYPITAKALGFPRQIAHGMWSLARCVAALENRLPDAVTVEVGFKKPIFLPGTVAFGLDPAADDLAFALTSPKDGSPHLVGRAVPL
jgi:acyl dehydratase